jgi:hypothetical protein
MSRTHPATLEEALARAEEKYNRNREKERAQRRDWYALLYGLRLRQLGYAPAEAARLVIESYPHTKDRLQRLVVQP